MTERVPPRIDGKLYDIPHAVRIYQRYTHIERANKMASRRQGFRQRQQEGEFFWIHPLVPGIAFPTRKAALEAALGTLGAGASA